MRPLHLGFIPVGLALLAGCSDPVPPTPRGAWVVNFSQPSVNPSQCLQAGHTSKLGEVSATRKELSLADGTEEAEIECTVKASGSGFSVSAAGRQKDRNLVLSIASIASSATEMSPAKGALSYVSSKTGDGYNTSSEEPCSFYFIPSQQDVAAGRVWVTFKCPVIQSEGSKCQLDESYAIFENCSEQ